MARSRRYGGRTQQNRGQNNYTNSGYSPRQKQNALKNIERYMNMAKDAAANGDLHQAENYYQHADHYHRVAHANDDYEKRDNDDVDNEEEQSNDSYAEKPDNKKKSPHSIDAPQPDVPETYKPVTEKPIGQPKTDSRSEDDDNQDKPKRKYSRRKKTDDIEPSAETVSEEKPKRKYTRRKKVDELNNND